MLHSTRGIVFRQVKYADSSLIVSIYTEKLGLQAYLVRGVRKAKAKIKANLFQHLNLLDLVVYHKEKSQLQNIKEVKASYIFRDIPTRIEKSTVLIFLNEILLKSIKEEEANEELFSYLENSLVILDNSKHVAHFHLVFLIQLSKYLGFYPRNNMSDKNSIFNMQEGFFESESFSEHISLDKKPSRFISELLNCDLKNHETLTITKTDRQELLDKIIRYYELHVPGFKKLNSLEILQQVFE